MSGDKPRVIVRTRQSVLQEIRALRNDLAEWERLEREHRTREDLEERIEECFWLLGDPE